MLNILLWILIVIAVLFALLRFVLVPMGSTLPTPIQSPNSENHTLSPCPNKPNCVSSTATRNSQKIDALAFEGSPKDAIAKLKDIVTKLPKHQIITEQDNYLHVTFKSPLMEFVDDTEFLINEGAAAIEVRSAARLGRRDFDKNRERIEFIRERFNN